MPLLEDSLGLGDGVEEGLDTNLNNVVIGSSVVEVGDEGREDDLELSGVGQVTHLDLLAHVGDGL